jgi:aquaporin Z
MRLDVMRYLTAVAGAGVVAGVTVASVRTQDPALAGVAIAAAVGLLAILTAAGPLGVAAVDPAWTLALLVRRRVGIADLLPIWAAQAVGAVAFAALARWVVDELPAWSVVEQPDVAPAAVLVGLAGLVGSWVAIGVDAGRAAPIALGLPALVAAVALPPTFAAGANPAGLFALGVGGVAEWDYVFFTAVAAFGGAVLGAITAPIFAGTTAERDAFTGKPGTAR